MLRTGCTNLSPSGLYGVQRSLRLIEVDCFEGRNSAAYTVATNTFLKATVPPGASGGFVTVVTPSGTLKRSKRFIVEP